MTARLTDKLAAIWQHSLFRFLLVGGSMALVYALSTAILTGLLPLPPALTAVLVWLACIPPAFWAQRRFTFAASTPHRHALALYALTQGLGMVIVSVAAALFASREMTRDLLLYLAASALAAVVSYGINRMVIFAAAPPPKAPQKQG